MPTIPYWHLWTDANGTSHFAECALEEFDFKGIGGADPQWNKKIAEDGSGLVFTVQPVGWVGEWHENPAPQWIVPVSGRWWVEAMDGTRREFGPGEVHFGEDQNCKEWNGRQGHRSGTIGDTPCVLMCVRLSSRPIRKPGHFK
ncbi:MAG: cupin domain-containing protein [Rhodospirillales bacterium]|nr:cupin domain-containing protein [Rhodospirillales bacterium]MDE2319880.1 cupin domain-containing protein [Rhodospirillales bacterium]